MYIAHRGGLRPDADLRAIGLTNKSRVIVPGLGYRSVLRNGGMTMDEAREALIEGGYLPAEPEERPGDSGTFNTIRELIDEELRGRKHYAAGEESTDHAREETRRIEESDARLEANRAEIHAELVAVGIAPTSVRPEDVQLAAEIMATEGLSADEAFERAVMRNALDDGTFTTDDVDAIYGQGAADAVQPPGAQGGMGEAAQPGRGQADAQQLHGAHETFGLDDEEAPHAGNEPAAKFAHPTQAAEGAGRAEGADAEPEPAEGVGDGRITLGRSEGVGRTRSIFPGGASADRARIDRTAAGEQSVLPGAEPTGQGEQAQRKANEPLKPSKPQKPADEGLFGDESRQGDLGTLISKSSPANQSSRSDTTADQADDAHVDERAGFTPTQMSKLLDDEIDQLVGMWHETKIRQPDDASPEHLAIVKRMAKNLDELGLLHATSEDEVRQIMLDRRLRGETVQPTRRENVDLEVNNDTAEIPAADSDETVTVRITKAGPWDFNDTWPAPNAERLAEYEAQRGPVFGESNEDDSYDAEQVVGMLDETLNSMQHDAAVIRRAGKLRERVKSGKAQPPKRAPVEKYIKQLTADIEQARESFDDTAAELAAFFDNDAVAAIKREARERVLMEERSSPEQDEGAANALEANRKAEPDTAPTGAPPPSAGRIPAVAAPPEGMFIQIGRTRYQVGTYKEASEKIDTARARALKQGVPPAEINSALLVNGAGDVVGHVSYNGRVWEGTPQDWSSKTRILYDNRKPDSTRAPEGGTLPTEASDGLQGAVPAGDGREGAGDVQAPVEVGRAGEAGRADGARGDQALPGADEGRGAQPENGPSADRGEEGSRGAGESGDVRLPGRDEPGAGRGERAPHRPADRVSGENFRIEPGALAESRGPKAKAQDNVRAIELLHQIESEARPATVAEQADLAKYVGWGGIKGAFPDADGGFTKGYEQIGAKLKDLLTPAEYATARRSIQYAHYTAENVVRAMWSAAQRLGFSGGRVFEPGMGVGNFAGMMPAAIATASDYHGIELDQTTARIAKLLYPRWGVRQGDVTKTPVGSNLYDLAIGNPPFADIVVRSDPDYAKHGFLLHDYFFAKSIDAVRPGGLLMFISSAGTMNKKDPGAREYLADRADLVGAVRLPNTAFKANAGTEVTTDILVLRKRLPNETAGDRTWTETVERSLPNREGGKSKGLVNRYFAEHPDMVLGQEGWFDELVGAQRYGVRPKPGADLSADLAAAFDRLPAGVMTPWAETRAASIETGITEKKDGSFYLGEGGRLMQAKGRVGVPVERRGKGVEGGRSAADIERIAALVPIRDALRDVYAADLAENTKDAEAARSRLNASYDAFVRQFGPINKAEIQKRRPNSVQEEVARSEAREEARYAGVEFDEGTFDAAKMLRDGLTTMQVARARKEARAAAANGGQPWNEGSFDPEEMPDVIIDRRPNVDPFMEDPESYRLRAIEHYSEQTGRAEKSAVFHENVISRLKQPEINSVNDAVLHVLNVHGRLDIGEIAHLVGKSESETIEALGEGIYREPGTQSQWVTRDEYLSGNVRKKLAIAREAARKDPELRRNVTALEAAQPAPLGPSQIHATLGMPWIPQAHIETFGKENLGLDKLRVRYVPALAQWIVSGDTESVAAVSTYGTERRRAPALLEDALNRRSPKVYDEYREDGRLKRELNVAATAAAQEKLKVIQDRFADWVWADTARTDELAGIYNERYNNIVVREYDGSYLTTPGVSTAWSWRPHQKRAIARAIQSGNTYIAHAVGAGKTSEYIGIVMEKRRLGLARKPMITVPNHMLGQFVKEFYEQYPTAKIMVADERNFHTDRRKQFIANAAAEDLDAVVITHSAFGMIPISDAFADKVVQDEIAEYRDLLSGLDKTHDNRITRGRIENQIERLEQRLAGRSNRRRDQVFTFEEMGVDFLVVDEAHIFRKLDFSTQMGSVKGISPEGSGMAWDLYVKSLYLDTLKPGHGLIMGSGTPVTNTMAELYTVSRYLQGQELAERGLAKFDAWAASFGEPVTDLEQNAAGGYAPVTRFARFVNVPELSSMVRQAMDVVTPRQLEQYVTRPKIKGGKRQMNLADKSPMLEAYQRTLAARMKKIAERKGPPQKGDDIMLSVINDGRHAAIDMRLVYPELENDSGSKLNLLVDNVFRIWEATKAQPLHRVKDGAYETRPALHGPATQMIFTNLGLSGNRGFSVPDYIRAELVRRGVPKSEIAFIYDAKTHVARQKLFNDMNAGKIRNLIGSTAKMATGVNAQVRLYATHNLDPLWYPSDDEQRNGRTIRQGNMNPEVEVHDYSTKGTYDSTMWGMMARKARFIEGFFEGDPTLRDMDDLGEASQYEQARAITTNDPRLIELTEQRQALERASRKKSAFEQEAYALRQHRADARSSAEHYEKRLAATTADIAQREDTAGDKFKGTVGKTAFTDRSKFGEAAIAVAEKLAQPHNAGKEFTVGKVGGFPLQVTIRKGFGERAGVDVEMTLVLSSGFEREVKYSGNPVGVVRSIEGAIRGLDSDLAHYQAEHAKAARFIAESEDAAKKKPYAGNAEIAELTDKVRQLEAELSAEAKPNETPAESTADEEPQASVRPPAPQLGPKLSQDHRAITHRVELERRLTDIIERMVGKRVRVQFEDTLPLPNGAQGWGSAGENATTAAGLYLPAAGIVRLAMADPIYTAPLSTAYHEAYHAVERLIAKPDEIALLNRELPRLRETISRANFEPAISPEQLAQISDREVRTIAYELYAHDREKGGNGSGIHIGVRRIFERIRQFLRRIRNEFEGYGFRTAEDVFAAVYEGKVRERADREERSTFAGAAAAADRGEQYAIRRVKPRTAPLPRQKLEMPHESWRAALRDPNLSTRERYSAALDALMLTPSRALWDRIIDVARLQRMAELMEGKALPESLDVHMAATLYPGRAGERVKDAAHKLFAPIYDAMKARNVSREELHEYLYARHAEERNAQIRTIDPNNDEGSGMSDADARSILAQVQASGRQTDIDAVAKLADGIVAHNRALMERTGLEHASTIMQWEQAYKHYVPLKGAEASETEQPGSPSRGQGFDVRRPESRRALGRFDRAGDILANLLDQTNRTIIRSEKNRVGKAFMRFAQRFPSKLYKIGLAETRRVIDPQTGLVTLAWFTHSAEAKDVFGVKVAGVTHYIEIKHPGLLAALKNLGAERLPPMFRAIAAFTRQWSAFQTARNPEFTLTNVIRDLQDAGLNLNAEQQAGFRRAFLKNLGNGKALSAAVLGQIDRKNNTYGRLYDEWRLAGGKISHFGYKDVEELAKEADRELSRRTESMAQKIAAQPWRTVNPLSGHIVKLFEATAEVSESTTRLAVYAAAREVGMTQAQAAMAARSMTVDFNRQGTYGQWLKMAYAFANPSIQGNVNLVRRIRQSKRMRYAVMSVAMLGFALTMWNLWVSPYDDEEKKNAYEKLPYWVREKHWIVYVPGRKEALKIPIGYALAPFFMMGENAAMAAMGKKKPLDALGDWLGTSVRAFNPLGGEGSMFNLSTWLGMVSPTILDPMVELVRNRNWLDRPIHPDERPYDKGKPRSEISKIVTSPTAIEIAQKLNAISGGTHFSKGKLDFYPDDLEHVWNFALGGYGAFMQRNIGIAQDKIAGVDTPVERIPFVRRFVIPAKSEQMEREQFYDASREATEKSQTVRDAIRAQRKDVNTDHAQRAIKDLAPKVGLGEGEREGSINIGAESVFKNANKEIRILREDEARIRRDPSVTRADRQRLIEQNRNEQVEIMRRARLQFRDIGAAP